MEATNGVDRMTSVLQSIALKNHTNPTNVPIIPSSIHNIEPGVDKDMNQCRFADPTTTYRILDELGLKALDVPGDGACVFHCYCWLSGWTISNEVANNFVS